MTLHVRAGGGSKFVIRSLSILDLRNKFCWENKIQNIRDYFLFRLGINKISLLSTLITFQLVVTAAWPSFTFG